jgi:hypothetical protein
MLALGFLTVGHPRACPRCILLLAMLAWSIRCIDLIRSVNLDTHMVRPGPGHNRPIHPFVASLSRTCLVDLIFGKFNFSFFHAFSCVGVI